MVIIKNIPGIIDGNEIGHGRNTENAEMQGAQHTHTNTHTVTLLKIQGKIKCSFAVYVIF